MASGRLQIRREDGWAILPSSLKRPSGAPRFHLYFPPNLEDVGAQHVVRGELTQGYEPPTRNLVERILRPGDLFIDVGAHWGFFTLQAATHPCGDVRALAFEPDPRNGTILFKNILTNSLADVADLVCAACGSEPEIAPLVTNSSMGHSIRGISLKANFFRLPPKWVPIVTLDTALAHFPYANGRRLIIKVDAEGFDPRVVIGARQLLAGGRVALIVWETGETYRAAGGSEHGTMMRMIALLESHGFRHLRPPAQHRDGPLAPFDPKGSYQGNVFSVAAGVEV
jgi:FkbM family methyltransferase